MLTVANHSFNPGWVCSVRHLLLPLLFLVTHSWASSGDDQLDSLVVSAGGSVFSLSPSFNPSVYSYTCEVSTAVDMVNLTAVLSHVGAVLVVGFHSTTQRMYEGGLQVASGDAHVLYLDRGDDNFVHITITAPNVVDMQVYKLRLTRSQSANTDLESLFVTGGAIDEVGDLVISDLYKQIVPYLPSHDLYTIPVAHAVSITTVTATISDNWSVGYIQGKPVRSGVASHVMHLDEGSNPIEVVIHAQAGNTQTVTLDFVRMAGVVECVKWRQTKRCDPHGEREPESDRQCEDMIDQYSSGYCECENLQRTAEMSCDHRVFNCKDECARLRHNTAAIFGPLETVSLLLSEPL
jgi:hypothetical protein